MRSLAPALFCLLAASGAALAQFIDTPRDPQFSRLFQACEGGDSIEACDQALRYPMDPQSRDRLLQGRRYARGRQFERFVTTCRQGDMTSCDNALRMNPNLAGRDKVANARAQGLAATQQRNAPPPSRRRTETSAEEAAREQAEIEDARRRDAEDRGRATRQPAPAQVQPAPQPVQVPAPRPAFRPPDTTANTKAPNLALLVLLVIGVWAVGTLAARILGSGLVQKIIVASASSLVVSLLFLVFGLSNEVKVLGISFGVFAVFLGVSVFG